MKTTPAYDPFGTFIYNEEKVLRAVLALHNKKMPFDEKDYVTEARFSETNPKGVVVFVNEKVKVVKEKKALSLAMAWGWVSRCVLRIG